MHSSARIAVFAICGALWAVPARALEPDQLFEKISPSVVTIVAMQDNEGKSSSSGSGIVVAPRTVITNCNVLAQGKVVVVKTGAQIHPATLEFPDIERNLCQLRVPGLTAPAVELGSAAKLKIGQRVYAIGHPRPLEPSLSDGYVSSLRDVKAGVPQIQTTAQITPGASGGGLFDTDGKLIGITSGQKKDAQNPASAIPVEWIREVPARGAEVLARYASNKVAAAVSPSRPAARGSPAGNAGAYAAEWAPRIALLEKERGQLTLYRAVTLLLGIEDIADAELLQTHEGMLRRLSWNSAYAIGTDQKGNIIWGGGRSWKNASFATDTALEFCAGKTGTPCKVVMLNGDFLESNFLEAAKLMSVQPVAAARAAFLRSLAYPPPETRVTYSAGGGGGLPSFGFASSRE